MIAPGFTSAFAVDDTNLDYALGSEVRFVPAAGGTSTQLVPSWADLIVLDDANVYWTDNTTIRKAPLGGGTSTDVASLFGGFYVYGSEIYGGGAAEVYDVPTSGGTPTLFASTIHFTNLAVDATDVYAVGEGLVRLSRSDASSTTILPTNVSVEGLAIDAQTIFITEYNVGVVAVDKTSGTATTLSTLGTNSGLALDSTNVYFIDASTVYRVAKSGGALVALSSGALSMAVAVNSTHVYFATSTGVMRTPK